MEMKTATILLVLTGFLIFSCNHKPTQSESEVSKPAATGKSIPSDAEKQMQNNELVDRVKHYLQEKYLTEEDLRAIEKDQRTFQLNTIDLNGDGKNEVLVNFVSSYFCGTGGCTVLLLDEQLELITEFTVTRTPFYVERTNTNGWREILIRSGGKWRKLTYQSGSYPSNPSLVEATGGAPSESAEILFDNEQDEITTYSF